MKNISTESISTGNDGTVDDSMELLPLYKSMNSEESEDEQSSSTTKKKSRNTNRDWMADKKYGSLAEAMVAINSENLWSKKRTHVVSDGQKIYFRCNKVKLRGKDCTAGLYLLIEASSESVICFRSVADHDHQNSDQLSKPKGIDPLAKLEIDRLFSLNMKPKAILKHLAQALYVMPTANQLNNYLALLHKQRYGPNTISLGELTAWLEAHSVAPESSHESFVIDFKSEHESFKFAITTKALLSHLKVAKNIHADATYKLIWQGFPVLLVGTTDKDCSFHIIALAVTSNEKTEDFEFLFTAIKNAAEKFCNFQYVPNVLICDAAKAIHNGFRLAFGNEPLIRMCWAHMKKNVQKNLQKCIKSVKPTSKAV